LLNFDRNRKQVVFNEIVSLLTSQ